VEGLHRALLEGALVGDAVGRLRAEEQFVRIWTTITPINTVGRVQRCRRTGTAVFVPMYRIMSRLEYSRRA
jgi:hypothetical protein